MIQSKVCSEGTGCAAYIRTGKPTQLTTTCGCQIKWALSSRGWWQNQTRKQQWTCRECNKANGYTYRSCAELNKYHSCFRCVPEEIHQAWAEDRSPRLSDLAPRAPNSSPPTPPPPPASPPPHTPPLPRMWRLIKPVRPPPCPEAYPSPPFPAWFAWWESVRDSPESAYASEPPTPKFARPRPPPPPVPLTRAERGSRQNESAPDSKEKDDEVIEQNAPDSKENENDSKDDAVIAQNAPDSEQNESAPESKKSEQDASNREEEIEQDESKREEVKKSSVMTSRATAISGEYFSQFNSTCDVQTETASHFMFEFKKYDTRGTMISGEWFESQDFDAAFDIVTARHVPGAGAPAPASSSSISTNGTDGTDALSVEILDDRDLEPWSERGS